MVSKMNIKSKVMLGETSLLATRSSPRLAIKNSTTKITNSQVKQLKNKKIETLNHGDL